LRFLLAKHNIDMADVAEQDSAPSITEQEVGAEAWSRAIFGGLAKLYFCEIYIIDRGGKKSLCVIGQQENVAVAVAAAKNLVKACKRLAAEHERRADGLYGAARSFRVGFADRIHARCRELIAEAKRGAIADDETGTALVATDAYRRQEEINAEYLKALNLTRRPPRAARVLSSSYSAGRYMAEAHGLGQESLAAG